MTGEQYVRANKRVYNVVIILLAVMTILSVMACLAEFKITILLQTAAAVAGIIVVNTYAKKFWNSKKGGEILLGTGSAVYCVFLLLNQNNFVYAYGIPLFVACVLYLDVKFVYYGIGVTAVGNIIHIIVQVITKRADGIELFFSIIILATVVYAVYEASILLTKFSEENLEMQAAASEKMLATAENLVKHFDSAKEKLETLEVKETDFNRKKKVLISNEILAFESVEAVNDIIIDNIIYDNKLEDNPIEIIKSLTYKELKELIKELDIKNTNTVIVKK